MLENSYIRVGSRNAVLFQETSTFPYKPTWTQPHRLPDQLGILKPHFVFLWQAS
jgi:hypothetical protein